MTNNVLKKWVETARPKTLPLAIASIITGASLACWSGKFSWTITVWCLITTVLLQILSNFANDYGDHQKGSDTADRIGPLRAIQQGEISASQLKKGLIVVALASLCSGAILIIVAYQSLADLLAFSLLGLLAVVAAITYTVGAKPYGYMGLGDLSVLLFFGLLGVGGSYYLQTQQLNLAILLPAFASGLLASAVLNINNLRDIEQDSQVGKNTLAVRLGSEKGRIYHACLLLVAILCYLIFTLCYVQKLTGFIFLLALPLFVKHALFVYQNKSPLQLRPMLAQMSLLALLINLLFSLGLLIS
ncbi:1,4-dihydroxy-2-naphthoate polyprenyltransferase [Pasteurella multocida]|uniref:1,4-dihydroxy-2-naphthoate polyprenyltransferase n=1 Tax=Pasteurella multocida TaxID=747 RepID=UPI0020245009|nr:1,4-dihydroxy-2-naphthoate polyprenyltransferase [Pasteurella multocida]MEB3478246.1 1,4-dihydroxy-2-naphthoate polyprenyltransferase [Pasteurella multocida]MEB3493133.1 1,4-dihydroxy-2-naphthoate polyprenyltransferase [Pasteurella multocida]URJ92739.1 1,4-dihydroxy-2-naphthoate polyprenyltransferase [Pasteurella multocida]HDR1131392.1 1,4-dihydroxy-2-naphthoate polyprenyltransferase [Pasteurella multocida]